MGQWIDHRLIHKEISDSTGVTFRSPPASPWVLAAPTLSRDAKGWGTRLIVTEAERLKLSATVQSLRDRGLLTNDVAMPRLVVTIECDMTPCPLPGLGLPPLHR